MAREKDVYVQSKCDLGDPTDLRFPTCKGLVPGSAHLTGTTYRKGSKWARKRSYEGQPV